jgi:hypothetical protein
MRDVRTASASNPAMPLFAAQEPPRATRSQSTRWATQDEAFLSRMDGIAIRVLDAIRETPGTCDELEMRLGLTHQSCSSAINRLMRGGRVVATDSRTTRSGRRARVWMATK